MIICADCGKRKKIQNPRCLLPWRCSTCVKKRDLSRVEISCFDCQKTIHIQKSRVIKSEYYICGRYHKLNGTKSIDKFQEDGQILICKLEAAGEMLGFDISFPTDEQKEGLERARLLLDITLAQRLVEQKLKNGEQLNPHLN